MCFDLDSRPPIAPIAGGALDSRRLILTARRRQPPRGVRARGPPSPTGAARSWSCPTSAASTRTTRSWPCASPSTASTRWRSTGSAGRPGVEPPAARRSSTGRTSTETTWPGIALGHPGRRGRAPAPATTATRQRRCFTHRLLLRRPDVVPGRRPSDSGLAGRDRLLRLAASRSTTPARRRRPTSPARMRVPRPGALSAAPTRRSRRRRSRPSSAALGGRRRRPPDRHLPRARRTASSIARRPSIAEASAAAWDEVLRFVRRSARPDQVRRRPQARATHPWRPRLRRLDGPWRGRAGRPVGRRRRPTRASSAVDAAAESAKAMIVEPAPDRHAPSAPASRAAATMAGSCG